MSYCDYNPRLFKEFTSMKTKIKPQLSNTWTLKAQSYNKKETCILSNSEGVSIADISIKRLLQLMKEQNISLVGDKLIGNFIIGNDRSLYTEEMYNTWKEKFEERISTEIPTNELIEGHMYKTVCGSTLLYLGKRWVVRASIKEGYFKIGKPSTSTLCIPYFDPLKTYLTTPAKLNQKCIEDLGLYTGNLYNDWENNWVKDAQRYGFSENYTTIHVTKDKPDMNNMKLGFELKNDYRGSLRYHYSVMMKNDEMFLVRGNGYYGSKYTMSKINPDSLEFPIVNHTVDERTIKGLQFYYLILV